MGNVDHGGHQHQTVHTCLFGPPGGFAGAARGEFGHPTENRNFALRHRGGGFEDRLLLIQGEGGVFADGPQHDQPVDTARDQGLNVCLRPRQVHAQVFIELRRDGGENPFPVNNHVPILPV